MFVFLKGSQRLIFLLCLLNAAKCSSENGLFTLSARGHRLEGYLLKETKAASAIECLHQCLREDPRCKSINYGVTSEAKGKCQLNNATVPNKYNSKKLVVDKDFHYIERVMEGKPSFCDDPPKKYNTKDSLYSSKILGGDGKYLKQLYQWLNNQTKWKLCYRASEHGWGAKDFHSNCDGKGQTVTIARVGDYIFGGYSDVDWRGSEVYRKSSKAFLFSLRNKDNLQPFKSPVRSTRTKYAIRTGTEYGPRFGRWVRYGKRRDLCIMCHNHTSTNSYSDFGSTYQLPPGYHYGTTETRRLLAGSYYFQLSEVEVYNI